MRRWFAGRPSAPTTGRARRRQAAVVTVNLTGFALVEMPLYRARHAQSVPYPAATDVSALWSARRPAFLAGRLLIQTPGADDYNGCASKLDDSTCRRPSRANGLNN